MNIAMRTRIKRLREEKGISQSQMAERLHMDERNYKRIESGEKKTMDIDLLDRIAAVLETDVTDLLANESIRVDNISEITNNNDNGSASAIVAYEVNVNNTTAESMDLMQEMLRVLEANRKTIEDNNRLIALLLEQRK